MRQEFRWIDNEIRNDVDYQIAPAYPGYHEVTATGGIQTFSMFQDVVVYQNAPSFGAVGWYLYNVTTKQVYPLAQPYGVPNTVCDRYCYGESRCPLPHVSFHNACLYRQPFLQRNTTGGDA